MYVVKMKGHTEKWTGRSQFQAKHAVHEVDTHKRMKGHRTHTCGMPTPTLIITKYFLYRGSSLYMVPFAGGAGAAAAAGAGAGGPPAFGGGGPMPYKDVSANGRNGWDML